MDSQSHQNALNELLTLLITNDSLEAAQWEGIHQKIKAIAKSYPEDAPVRQPLSIASLKALEIIKGLSDAAPTQPEISAALEKALKELEASGTAAPKPAPQSKPVETASAPVEPAKPAPAPVAVSASDSADWFRLPEDTDFELLKDFLTESKEYVTQAEAALLTLETDPQDQEAINVVFRAFHTVKGTSAFLNLTPLTEFGHLAESLLSRVREGEIRYAGGYADLSLQAVDALKEFLEGLSALKAGESLAKPHNHDELVRILKDPEKAGITAEAKLPPGPPRLGDILVAEGKVSREAVEEAAKKGGGEFIGEKLVASGAAKVTDVGQALRVQKQIANAGPPSADEFIKVRTDRLDSLINMVGEMVLAHTSIAEDDVFEAGRIRDYDLLRKISDAGKIVRELQDLGMSLRMVPLKPTFQKMSRLVRDVAQKCNKQVSLVLEGEDTEIDRNIVDRIGDPLVHMIRNAIDHGIEAPEDRAKCGKAAMGTLKLMAYSSGGSVVIELSDDGKGLDRDKILKKGMDKGLVPPGQHLSDREVFNLIFKPGFSTAEKVTDLSGRGVGMDVVKQNIESLNGRVAIFSELGKGTTFSIRLPLTLAIIDGMLVRVGRERYILPIANIQLSFQPSRDSLYTVAGRGELVRLRDELLPLIRLHHVFHVPNAATRVEDGFLVVVGDGSRKCVFLVDELLGQEQVVAKSLGDGMEKVVGISGAAILGDGLVSLVLDPVEIISLSRQESAGQFLKAESPAEQAAGMMH